MRDLNRTTNKTRSAETLRAEIEREARELAEKQHAIYRAKDVLLSEVGRWTGIQLKRRDPIPLVRDGKQVGTIPIGMFSADPLGKVATASLIEHKTEIERKISAYTEIVTRSNALIEVLRDMTYSDLERLATKGNWLNRNALRGEIASLEERLIGEIGPVASGFIAAKALAANAKKQVSALNEELSSRQHRPGRPRNEAAHAVARELALLYAKVTGKRPTYAAGADGLSGDYTPALRSVFDALGWHATDLRGPAESAIAAITEADLQHVEMTNMGLLSSLSPE